MSTVVRHVGSRDSSLDRDEIDSKDLLSSIDDNDERPDDCMSMEEDSWFENWVQETAREIKVGI